MERQKFCKMLEIARGYSEKTTSTLSYDMRMPPQNIRRIERGLFNFRMDRCLNYLEHIGYSIFLEKDGEEVVIARYEDILAWFSNNRGKLSRPSLASDMGVDRSYIRLIESGQHKISVDLFLKLVEMFSYNLTLVPNEDDEQ